MPEYVFKFAAIALLLRLRATGRCARSGRQTRAHLKKQPTSSARPLRERVLLGVMGVMTIPLFVWFFGPWVDFAHVCRSRVDALGRRCHLRRRHLVLLRGRTWRSP